LVGESRDDFDALSNRNNCILQSLVLESAIFDVAFCESAIAYFGNSFAAH